MRPPGDVVVVGHGMAGARVVEDIRARDGAARITVLGAEPHPPYNRVLLSAVLAGRATVGDIALGGPSDVDVRAGVPAVAIDRRRRLVLAADGAELRYGALVLATGSDPVLPPVDGLRPDLPGVAVFRTLDDCRRILARGARRAIVLGGGLLGLEAARGLAGRGVDVTVVHAGPFLMERQLDPAAGRMLARIFAGLGVRAFLDTRTVRVLGSGEFRGLLLAGGRELAGDLLVVACGVRPSTGLARATGLRVRRGIAVDDAMRSVTDPRVYAVGECAEHAGRTYGLVAPAWEQAAVAAARISGADPAVRYAGSTLVTRLKAADVELAAMGEAGAHDEDGDGAEVVHFADPARGTYKKLVIRDGRLAGAILLGDVSNVGLLTRLYDRGAPVPPDRLGLLFPAVADGAAVDAAAADPAGLPDRATVCRCNAVSKGAIAACVLAGARSVTEVADRTRATTGCGGCADTVAALVRGLSAHGREPASVTA